MLSHTKIIDSYMAGGGGGQLLKPSFCNNVKSKISV